MALAVVGAAADALSSARYGLDFRDFLIGGARFIAGTNLYEGSGAVNGFIGLPFQALFHAPEAAIYAVSPAAALGLAARLLLTRRAVVARPPRA